MKLQIAKINAKDLLVKKNKEEGMIEEKFNKNNSKTHLVDFKKQSKYSGIIGYNPKEVKYLSSPKEILKLDVTKELLKLTNTPIKSKNKNNKTKIKKTLNTNHKESENMQNLDDLLKIATQVTRKTVAKIKNIALKASKATIDFSKLAYEKALDLNEQNGNPLRKYKLKSKKIGSKISSKIKKIFT